MNKLGEKSSLLFESDVVESDDNDHARIKSQEPVWKILVVDDDEIVHQVTLMVLKDFSFKNQALEIIQGYSGADAKRLMKEHPDVAVVLMDVVMETDSAGLEAVQYIRETLSNRFVRIILRTGQPGLAPEHEVITNYDINDYRDKTELTAQKLITTITTSLRAYNDLRKIEGLASSNINLEQRVRERTREIMKINQELQGEIGARRKAYQELQLSEARLSNAQAIAKIGNWDYDIETGELTWSEQLNSIAGLPGKTGFPNYRAMLDLVHEEDRDAIVSAINKALTEGLSFDIEHRLRRQDGSIGYVHQQALVEKSDTGIPIRISGTIQDVSQRRQTEDQMRKLSGAVDQIADAVMITDKSGVMEYVNPAFEKMTGFSRAEVIGKTPSILKSDKQHPAFYQRLWKTILRGETFSDVIINRRKNGSLYYEEKTITPQLNSEGEVVHFISTGKDVTERIESQERLHHLAHHDALTGLPNRVLLLDRLNQALTRSLWRSRKIAVMFLDMDRFKVINDTLGHDAGDDLLKLMSERLLDCVRPGDTVARLGGDEFAVILNDIARYDDVLPVAKKILETLTQPVHINEHELFITSSIGISMFPNDGGDSHTLLKKADVAMYRAKEKGKDNFQFYTSDDDNRAVERLTMETQLRRALVRDEFTLNFQPQLSLVNGEIIGLEALIRWKNKDKENVSPMQFIPILEETGMIIPVGDWVLQKACQQQKAWQEAGFAPHRIAVNLSIRQFQSRGLVKRLEEILSETGLAPEYLELEITENLLIDQIKDTAKLLHELHEMGVFLSIDDFGTGYSSMNYLKRLPFDNLKIDRMFVRDVTNNPDDAAITTAIIDLAHTMKLQVIAEGVETKEQLQFLKGRRCDAMQGFLFCPPIDARSLEEFITSRHQLKESQA